MWSRCKSAPRVRRARRPRSRRGRSCDTGTRSGSHLSAAEVVLVGAGALLAVYAVQRLVLTLVAIGARDPEAPAAGQGDARPFVTVQLPLYNEPAVAARLVD